jgi:hypothetical protein
LTSSPYVVNHLTRFSQNFGDFTFAMFPQPPVHARARAKKTTITRRKFSPEEDMLILQSVLVIGLHDWQAVIRSAGISRTPRQVRERWFGYLSRSIDSIWTEEEDELLMRLYAEHGPRWAQIARIMGNKPNAAARNRWLVLTRNKCLDNMFPASLPEPTFPRDIDEDESEQSDRVEVPAYLLVPEPREYVAGAMH